MLKSDYHLLWPRQSAAPSSGAGGGGVVNSDDLIEEAEAHFNVSGTSVLAAWGLTLVAGVSAPPTAPADPRGSSSSLSILSADARA